MGAESDGTCKESMQDWLIGVVWICRIWKQYLRDIVLLLWRWSQHWRNEYPTSQPDIHCKTQCLQTLRVMCFVVAMLAMLFSFLKRIDNPSIPLSKANIQFYFVNGYLGHGKRGKDEGRCVYRCNQAKIIKTPN